MFDSLNSPVVLLANACTITILAVMFYRHHARKYDAMLVFMVGNMIGLIVRFFVDLDIGVGTGFGLFAIFSLMHFRENYTTSTMVYLFLSLSFGILSSMMESDDIYVFCLLSVTVLLFLIVFEMKFTDLKRCIYHVPTQEIEHIREYVTSDIAGSIPHDIRIIRIRGGEAKVQVTYSLKKK